jgi:hypothetical protein
MLCSTNALYIVLFLVFWVGVGFGVFWGVQERFNIN